MLTFGADLVFAVTTTQYYSHVSLLSSIQHRERPGWIQLTIQYQLPTKPTMDVWFNVVPGSLYGNHLSCSSLTPAALQANRQLYGQDIFPLMDIQWDGELYLWPVELAKRWQIHLSELLSALLFLMQFTKCVDFCVSVSLLDLNLTDRDWFPPPAHSWPQQSSACRWTTNRIGSCASKACIGRLLQKSRQGSPDCTLLHMISHAAWLMGQERLWIEHKGCWGE